MVGLLGGGLRPPPRFIRNFLRNIKEKSYVVVYLATFATDAYNAFGALCSCIFLKRSAFPRGAPHGLHSQSSSGSWSFCNSAID